MKQFVIRLDKALETQIRSIDLPGGSLEHSRFAIGRCKKAMSKIKSYISKFDFSSEYEELEFFKTVKPLIYSKYIYYISVYNYLMKVPPGGEEARKAHIEEQLSRIRDFFQHNLAFYQYYRAGQTHRDKDYFTRDGAVLDIEIEDFDAAGQYATSHDYKLSKLIANERFQEYLRLELARIEYGPRLLEPGQSAFPFSHPVWTGTQTDVVELVYALKAAGAINNGNVDISELVGIFEFVFGFEVKETYHKFLDIGRRKKDVPVFINKLKEGLIRTLDEKLAYNY